MKSNVILIVLIFTIIISCSEKQQIDNHQVINGLWLVKEVKINDQDMTPIADWIRFNADSTQTSGTGWLQHTIGSWSYQNDAKILTIKNNISSNGSINYEDFFNVTFDKNLIVLQRKNEGKGLSITLEKADKLPTLEANKLFGLWKFNSILIDNIEVSDSLNPTKNAMLDLRPENGYTLYNYPKGERYGIFKAHYGKQQLEMVNYSRSPKFQFYKFTIDGNKLLLNSTDNKTVLSLSRIDKYLP